MRPACRVLTRPITSLEVLHAWMDDVTEEWQDDRPWVRAAWESVRDKVNVSASGFGGTVWHTCRPTSTAATCSAIEMPVSQIGLGVIVHELVHVDDGETGLAPSKAWGGRAALALPTSTPIASRAGESQGWRFWLTP